MLHQCGSRDLEAARQAYADAGVEARVEPILEREMALVVDHEEAPVAERDRRPRVGPIEVLTRGATRGRRAGSG